MNIDRKLREMEPKDTPLLVFGYILLGMMMLLSIDAKADDNEVLIEQVGNDVIIEADQQGYDNIINIDLGIVKSNSPNNIFRALQDGHDNDIIFSVDGDGNEVAITQEGNNNYIGLSSYWGAGHDHGGDIDGDNNVLNVRQKCSYTSCNENTFEFHIEGNSNDVMFGQGYFLDNPNDTSWAFDNNEPGGNFIRLDIHGDNNDFKGAQKMDSSSINHNMYVNIFGDDNNVFANQWQNGNKTLNLNIYNDDNDIDIRQKKNQAHTATISLYGSYGTNLSLTQSSTTAAQTYTLSQTCVTVGGCSISVTQD